MTSEKAFISSTFKCEEYTWPKPSYHAALWWDGYYIKRNVGLDLITDYVMCDSEFGITLKNWINVKYLKIFFSFWPKKKNISLYKTLYLKVYTFS